MRLVVLLVGLLAALTTPAYAETGQAFGNLAAFSIGPDDARMTLVECDAVADPGTTLDVPVAASVACTIDGVEHRAVAPGPFAATVFPLVSKRSFEICVWAEGVFHNLVTHTTYRSIAPWRCVPFEG